MRKKRTVTAVATVEAMTFRRKRDLETYPPLLLFSLSFVIAMTVVSKSVS